MELLFEFLFDCLFSGAVEGSRCKKIPMGIRIFLGLFVALFVIAVIGLIVLVGVLSLKDNIALSIFMFALAGFMGFMAFRKAATAHKEAVQKENAFQADIEGNDNIS